MTENTENTEINMAEAVSEISEGLGFEPVNEPEGGDEPTKPVVTEPVETENGDENASTETSKTPVESGEETSASDNATGTTTEAEPAAEPGDDGEPALTDDGTAIAPKTWRPEAAEAWEKLPDVVKTEIAKRENDIFKGIEQYREDANLAQQFGAVYKPFMPMIQQAGLNPLQLTTNLLNAHQTMAFGTPDQKNAMFAKLKADYGLTDNGFIGGENDEGVENAAFDDPQVAFLQNELKNVKSQLDGFTTQQQNTIRDEMTTKVNAFVADPANIYVNDVANEMASLLESGTVTDLKDAYEKAVWLNPITREKEMARMSKEKAAVAAGEAQKNAEKARKLAATNVKSDATPVSVTTEDAVGTMEDTLSATFDKINSRN